MGATEKLIWTAHPEGELHHWESGAYRVTELECKNEHGNKWQVFFHNCGPIGFETADEAKSFADADNRVRRFPTTLRIKILRDNNRETRRIGGLFFASSASIPLRSGEVYDLSKPAEQLSDHPLKYALVFPPIPHGCVDLFRTVDFDFI